MTELRIETDSLGEDKVPSDKLWGVQTQRSLFTLLHWRRLNSTRDDHGLCRTQKSGCNRQPPSETIRGRTKKSDLPGV